MTLNHVSCGCSRSLLVSFPASRATNCETTSQRPDAGQEDLSCFAWRAAGAPGPSNQLARRPRLKAKPCTAARSMHATSPLFAARPQAGRCDAKWLIGRTRSCDFVLDPGLSVRPACRELRLRLDCFWLARLASQLSLYMSQRRRSIVRTSGRTGVQHLRATVSSSTLVWRSVSAAWRATFARQEPIEVELHTGSARPLDIINAWEHHASADGSPVSTLRLGPA
ncbi:uncharacterized protein PSFLO_06776 [Pseudozyma flocculosa]|uniref:Uncharacterized protein n=1 Tax=Pseudozyma flocculosa TaxID=84751 RepID=A0A5C3FA47_9BASI|nr:uncharacterized protein PSFLO_06776 [Pseudozyma flocculosa]